MGIILGTALDTTGTSVTLAGDFPGFYVQAEILRRELALSLYDFHLQHSIQNELWPQLQGTYNPAAYPPFTALILYPLAMLNHQTAQFVFTGIMLCLLSYSVTQLTFLNSRLKTYRYPLLAALLLFVPTFISIFAAQNTMLCVVLFLLSIRLQLSDRNHNQIIGGALIGLSLFKPQYGALFFIGSMCIRPSKHTLLGFLAASAFIWSISAWYFSLDWVWWWIRSISPFDHSNLIVNILEVVSLRGLLTALGYDYSTGWILNITAVAASLFFLIVVSRRKSLSPKNLYAILLSLLPILAPQTLFYDLPIALFGFLLICNPRKANTLAFFIVLIFLGIILSFLRGVGVPAAFMPIAILLLLATNVQAFDQRTN